LISVLLAVWIGGLAVPAKSRLAPFLTGRIFTFGLPLAILGRAIILARHTGQGYDVIAIFAGLVLVWFFMLWRHYFYLQLGGTVHFSIALAAIASGEKTQSLASHIAAILSGLYTPPNK
jgi:hypothetical protein